MENRILALRNRQPPKGFLYFNAMMLCDVMLALRNRQPKKVISTSLLCGVMLALRNRQPHKSLHYFNAMMLCDVMLALRNKHLNSLTCKKRALCHTLRHFKVTHLIELFLIN